MSVCVCIQHSTVYKALLCLSQIGKLNCIYLLFSKHIFGSCGRPVPELGADCMDESAMALPSDTRGGQREMREGMVNSVHLREPSRGVQEGLTQKVSYKLDLEGFMYGADVY